jgi:hypothetical protein
MYVLTTKFPLSFKPQAVLASPCPHPEWDQPQRGNRHTLAERRVR